MAKKDMKRCSSSLVVREMQIRTTMRYYLAPVRMATIKKSTNTGFPGGAVVRNLPASAGDTGSSPGPGISHIPRSNLARAPQLLSLRSRAREPQLLKPVHLEPMLCNKRSHCNKKPTCSNEDPTQPKINKINLY